MKVLAFDRLAVNSIGSKVFKHSLFSIFHFQSANIRQLISANSSSCHLKIVFEVCRTRSSGMYHISAPNLIDCQGIKPSIDECMKVLAFDRLAVNSIGCKVIKHSLFSIFHFQSANIRQLILENSSSRHLKIVFRVRRTCLMPIKTMTTIKQPSPFLQAISLRTMKSRSGRTVSFDHTLFQIQEEGENITIQKCAKYNDNYDDEQLLTWQRTKT